MTAPDLLQFFGETIASIVGPQVARPMTAHELKLVDRAWREKYLDSLVHAPCDHPDNRRIGERHCTDCGKNIGPYRPEKVETPT